jgi:hypothetical protein
LVQLIDEGRRVEVPLEKLRRVNEEFIRHPCQVKITAHSEGRLHNLPVFSTPVKQRVARPSFPTEGLSAALLKGDDPPPKLFLSTSKCFKFKMPPFAIKIHLE